MNNKLEIKRRKRWFKDVEWRYTITAAENGLVISGATQWYSRRTDMSANIRRLYNEAIIAQLDQILRELDAK